MYIKRYRRNGRAFSIGEYVLYEDYKKNLSEENDRRLKLESEMKDLRKENMFIKEILHLTREVECLRRSLKRAENE